MRLLLIVLALTACATEPERRWYKPGASGADYAMDQGQCQAQGFAGPNATTVQFALVFNACMRGKGWQLR